MKIFIYIIIALVTMAVIAGFFVIGSPQEERMRRFDEKRAQDLQQIQYQIVNYWSSKSQLPQTLSQLKNDISGFSVPKDPQTGEDYKYEIKNSLIFALCADFSLPSLEIETGKPVPVYDFYGYTSQNWQHKEGLVCFERKIDPQLYPPKR